MKKIILVIFLGIFCFSQDLDVGRFNDYSGTINKKWSIRVSMYLFENGDIKGTYFYTKHNKKILIEGTQSSRGITLREYNSNNVVTGLFEGKTFSDSLDRFTGFWKNSKTQEKYSFELELDSTFRGSWGERYIEAGISSEKKVEEFTKAVYKSIVSYSTNKIIKYVKYPFVAFLGDNRVEIKSEEEFRRNYAKIFYPEFVEQIKKIAPINLSASYEGIQFGDKGEIWIRCIKTTNDNCDLKIVTINNLKM